MLILENLFEFVEEKILFNKHINNPAFALKRNLLDYDFLMKLDSKEYEKYLKLAYSMKLGKKLNLNNPKTFTEKIQWLKLYDNIPIKTELTDKVLVRDWVKEKIGEKYLKPVFQVCNTFDEIEFESLPDSFVLKCNHGCKWQFIIKDKTSFLDNKFLFDYTKKIMTDWLATSYFGIRSNFETQYLNIVPKILIEKVIRDGNILPEEIEVWTFNGKPKIIETHQGMDSLDVNIYDENYNQLDFKYTSGMINNNKPVSESVKKAVELSKVLAKDFKLVRVDWMNLNGDLYFNEMTFTPRSGYITFPKGYEYWNKKLGKMLALK